MRDEICETRSGPPGVLPLRSPADLAVAVPYLLGFHPRDSLVVVSLRGPRGRQVSSAARIDLPRSEHAGETLRHLAPSCAAHCDEVLLVVVGDSPDGSPAGTDPTGPPHRPLVSLARAAFEAVGVPLTGAVWVPEIRAGRSWRCYDSGASGTLPDPASSALAAATVAAGQVTYPDRSALECLVAPAPEATLARRGQLLDQYCDLEASGDPGADRGIEQLALLQDWAGRAGRGSCHPCDEDVVALAVALSDPLVRDAAFGLVLGSAPAAAEQLWTTLVRELPEPEAAEAAVLLAHAALVRGNGALVGIALERAQRAWPGHRMSALLRSALDHGLHPGEIEGWFAEGAAEARRLLRRQADRRCRI